MITNDIYRRLRYRADDPLRYSHVARRDRQETDAGHHLDARSNPEMSEDLPDEQPFGEVVAEADLS